MSNVDFCPHRQDLAVILLRVKVLNDLVEDRIREICAAPMKPAEPEPPQPPAESARAQRLRKPLPASYQAAMARIAALKPRQRIVYHTGHLSRDRKVDTALAGTVAAYQEAADRGGLILWQRRIGPKEFQYIAFRKG